MTKHNPADLTIGALLRLLKPAQLYGVLATSIALIAGAFTAGLAVSNYKVERIATEAESVQKSYEKANVNLEFFTKFLRYAITKKQTEEDGYLRYVAVHEEARNEFVRLVKTWHENQNKVGSEFRLTPEVHKSYDLAASFVILPDGSKWPIPYEVKESVIGRKP